MRIFPNNYHKIDQIIRKIIQQKSVKLSLLQIHIKLITELFEYNSSTKYYVLSLLKIDKCVSFHLM